MIKSKGYIKALFRGEIRKANLIHKIKLTVEDFELFFKRIKKEFIFKSSNYDIWEELIKFTLQRKMKLT